MAVQAGVSTNLIYKTHTGITSIPAGSAGQVLRRVSFDLNMTKDTAESREVRTDLQVADFRHTTIRNQGSIEAELSTQSLDDLLEATLRGTWAAGASGSATISVTSNVVTRALGSFLTDGIKIGDIVRFTGFGSPGTANNSINVRVTAVSASALTIASTDTLANVTTAQNSINFAVTGKKLTIGTTGRLFAFEGNHGDIDVSQLFYGCRLTGFRLQMPPTGIATITFNVMGANMTVLTGSAAPYFTAPTAAPTTSVLAAANGKLSIGGTDYLVVTGLDLNVDMGAEAPGVVGSNLVPEIFTGRIRVTGTLTTLFENETLLNLFKNETASELLVTMEAPGSAPAEFMTFRMMNLKFGGAQVNNNTELGVPITLPFQALLKSGGSGTAYDTSTLVIQRSNP